MYFVNKLKPHLNMKLFRLALSELLICAAIFAASGCIAVHYIALTSEQITAVFYPPTIAGLAWTKMRYFFVYGITAVFSFGIFRLAANRVLAVFAVLMVATSPMHLYILKSAPFRDYYRAPYIVGALFGMCLVAKGKAGLTRIVIAAGIIGVTCGLGATVREEVTLYMAPGIVAVILLSPWRSFGRSILNKTLGLIVLISLYLLTAPPPIFHPYSSAHTAPSFTSIWNRELGLSNPPYDIGYLFLDEHANAVEEVLNSAGDSSALSTYIKYFPADFVTRIYASAIRILQSPFAYQLPPQGITSGILKYFYLARAVVQDIFAPFILPITVASIFALMIVDPGLASIGLIWLGFLASLFTTQFFGRHFFYSEFYSWLMIVSLITSIKNRKVFRGMTRINYYRAAILVIGFGVTLSLATLILREHQSTKLRSVFTGYLNAETSLGIVSPPLKKNGILFFPRPSFPKIKGSTIEPLEFLSFEFGGEKCKSPMVWPVLRYHSKDFYNGEDVGRIDWSRTLAVPTRTDQSVTVKLFYVAFKGFTGIEIPAEYEECMLGYRRIEGAGRPKLLLTAIVPSAGDYGELFQRLAFGNEFHSSIPRMEHSVNLSNQSRKIDTMNLTKGDMAFISPIVHFNHSNIDIKGYALAPMDPNVNPMLDRSRSLGAKAWHEDISVSEIDTDLFYTRPLRLTSGSAVIVHGTLAAGGITIGLTKASRSAGEVTITTPGRFSIRLPINASGEYIVGISNHMSWYTSLENRSKIEHLAISDPSINIEMSQ